MLLAFNPMTHVRRLQQARRLRRGAGLELPAWALGEVTLSAAQAAWLQRALFGWFALPLRQGLPARGAPVSLQAVTVQLAAQGLHLRACRLGDPGVLQRGDVIWLADDTAARLFGASAAQGGGLALVVDAGAEVLRLSPALAPDALSCRGVDLRRQLGGWVLRAQVAPSVPLTHPSAGWEGALAAA